ncbi:MAG: hypothetical protein QOG15_1673 [Solirubrobacteraceae bacterium]|jgi:hypothetical protein|nr:hypothetical protein [Solirubrobacteraceae bacterium]
MTPHMGEPGPRRIITVDPPEPATTPQPEPGKAPAAPPQRDPEKVPA